MNNEGIKSNAATLGIVAFSLAIIALIIPVVGVLLVTPVAIVFTILALVGGYKEKYIQAAILIIAINLVISPSFWLNIGASFSSVLNAALTIFDIAGVIVMVYLLKKKPEAKATV